MTGATIWYGVTTVDSDGRESVVSVPVAVDVPETNIPIIDGVSFEPTTAEAMKGAVDWLMVNQDPRGFWSNRSAQRALATSQALNGLYRAGEKNLATQKGLFFLRGTRTVDNGGLARSIITLHRDRQFTSALGTELLGRAQWDSGQLLGWGTAEGFNADAVHSSLGRLAASDLVSPGNDQTAALLHSPTLKVGNGQYSWTPHGSANVYVSALAHHALGSRTVDHDLDEDGLFDWWELLHYGSTQSGANRDSDGDGCSSYDEIRFGTDPNDSDSSAPGCGESDAVEADADSNGLWDWWEEKHQLTDASSDEDPDGDGLNHVMEMRSGTDPQVAQPALDCRHPSRGCFRETRWGDRLWSSRYRRGAAVVTGSYRL